MAKTDDRKSIRCSFCGKPQSLVERLIAGNGSYICDECVKLCMSIVDENYVAAENPGPCQSWCRSSCQSPLR